MDGFGNVLAHISRRYLLRKERINVCGYADGDTLCIHTYNMNNSNTYNHTCQELTFAERGYYRLILIYLFYVADNMGEEERESPIGKFGITFVRRKDHDEVLVGMVVGEEIGDKVDPTRLAIKHSSLSLGGDVSWFREEEVIVA